MGTVNIALGNTDPRRWRDPDSETERRWEETFGRLRRTAEGLFDQGNTLEARHREIVQLQDTLEARPNTTSGTGDRVLMLAGSRGVRGTRTQTMAEAFTEWSTGVTFAAAYPSAPVVVLTPVLSGPGTASAVLTNVTASGFDVRWTATAGQTTAAFHFQAWGDT